MSGCEGLSISLSSDTSAFLESTNRYGSGWNGSAFLNTSFGYGSGVAAVGSPAHLTWNVEWNTTGLPAGAYTVDYFVTSSGGSQSREYRLEHASAITLSGPSGPSASVAIAPYFPQGSNYVFLCEASGLNATSYDWTFGDGSKLLGRATKDVYHTFPAAGDYAVSCVAHDGATSAQCTLGVTVAAPQSTTLSVKAPYPINGSYVLVCNTTVQAPVFDWAFGDGSKLLNVLNGDVFHTYASGNYTASCTAKNGTASVSATLPIFVASAPPQAASANLSIKPPFPMNRNAVFVCTTAGIANPTFSWTFGDGQKQSGGTSNNVWHTYASSGAYNVSCTAKNATVSAASAKTFTI